MTITIDENEVLSLTIGEYLEKLPSFAKELIDYLHILPGAMIHLSEQYEWKDFGENGLITQINRAFQDILVNSFLLATHPQIRSYIKECQESLAYTVDKPKTIQGWQQLVKTLPEKKRDELHNLLITFFNAIGSNLSKSTWYEPIGCWILTSYLPLPRAEYPIAVAPHIPKVISNEEFKSVEAQGQSFSDLDDYFLHEESRQFDYIMDLPVIFLKKKARSPHELTEMLMTQWPLIQEVTKDLPENPTNRGGVDLLRLALNLRIFLIMQKHRNDTEKALQEVLTLKLRDEDDIDVRQDISSRYNEAKRYLERLTPIIQQS